MEIKDAKENEEQATKQYNEIKSRMDELMAKIDQVKVEKNQAEEKIAELESKVQDLSEFKRVNENVATVFHALTELFKKEPLFKTFNLVRDVGEMNIEDLKNALGVPSVTTKKYIRDFVDVGVFTINEETGKVTLVHKLPPMKND